MVSSQRLSFASILRAAACLGALLLLAPQSAWSTTVLQLNETQMVSMSSFIVRGKVVSQKSVAGPRGMGVVTLVTIQVDEELVGRNSPKTVVVRHFGGTLHGKNVRMIGGVSFTKGNEVVVFVQKSQYLPKGEYLLVGLNQGKWMVHRPPTNASLPKSAQGPMLVRSMAHVKLVQQPGLVGQKQGTFNWNRVSLKDMRVRLKQHYKKIVAERKARLLKLPKVKAVTPKVQVKPVRPQLIKPKVVPAPRRAVPTPVKPK